MALTTFLTLDVLLMQMQQKRCSKIQKELIKMKCLLMQFWKTCLKISMNLPHRMLCKFWLSGREFALKSVCSLAHRSLISISQNGKKFYFWFLISDIYILLYDSDNRLYHICNRLLQCKNGFSKLGNRLLYGIIDYISVKHLICENVIIDYTLMHDMMQCWNLYV